MYSGSLAIWLKTSFAVWLKLIMFGIVASVCVEGVGFNSFLPPAEILSLKVLSELEWTSHTYSDVHGGTSERMTLGPQ